MQYRIYYKKILKDKPFSNLINIIQIKELVSATPHTVFKVEGSHGKLYKLRKYKSSKSAKEIESAVKLVPQFFPKFYGRDKNYLLFDFIQGRILVEDENLNIIYKIGKMCGEINKYKITNNRAIDAAKKKFDGFLRKRINFILEKKIITKTNYRRILRVYEKLRKEIECDIVLGIYDISPSNFMIDSENKLYCIDEKKIGYFIKGYSFINPLIHWFNKEQKKSFFNGYNSVDSAKFFHKDYEKFSTLIYYIGKISYRLDVGRDYSDELKRLLQIKQH